MGPSPDPCRDGDWMPEGYSVIVDPPGPCRSAGPRGVGHSGSEHAFLGREVELWKWRAAGQIVPPKTYLPTGSGRSGDCVPWARIRLAIIAPLDAEGMTGMTGGVTTTDTLSS
jgi:hypothetical protein